MLYSVQFSRSVMSDSLRMLYYCLYLLERLKPQILPRMWVNSNSYSLQPLWKTVWQFLIKLNILLSYDPAVMLLGIYTKELKTYVHTETYTQMFISALFIVAKTQKQPGCPLVGEWINKHKRWYNHAVECHSAPKKRWAVELWKDTEETNAHY